MSAERKPSEGEHEAAEVVSENGGAQAPGATAQESGGAALAEAQARAEENRNLYLRAAAELENVRKRAARDVENAHKFALENFGRELLAVVDSLEMGLSAADSADLQALREGSEATCKLLKTTLERFGISEVDPQGEPFDPELHEAMSMMPAPNVEPGSVAQVIQKGYALNGRLLRPARVIVAAEAPPGGAGS
ncbi:MAG TPA: nucleotide exchange factor GrpE [Woeseiaceae bacterium]|nr:nucleotide exchange factor GrpE [Woeseiaceae bacterium]